MGITTLWRLPYGGPGGYYQPTHYGPTWPYPDHPRSSRIHLPPHTHWWQPLGQLHPPVAAAGRRAEGTAAIDCLRSTVAYPFRSFHPIHSIPVPLIMSVPLIDSLQSKSIHPIHHHPPFILKYIKHPNIPLWSQHDVTSSPMKPMFSGWFSRDDFATSFAGTHGCADGHHAGLQVPLTDLLEIGQSQLPLRTCPQVKRPVRLRHPENPWNMWVKMS